MKWWCYGYGRYGTASWSLKSSANNLEKYLLLWYFPSLHSPDDVTLCCLDSTAISPDAGGALLHHFFKASSKSAKKKRIKYRTCAARSASQENHFATLRTCSTVKNILCVGKSPQPVLSLTVPSEQGSFTTQIFPCNPKFQVHLKLTSTQSLSHLVYQEWKHFCYFQYNQNLL